MLGRIKNLLGCSTRPGMWPSRAPVSLPQVVYYDKVRNLILSADGLAARMSTFSESANVSLYLAGQP